MEAEKAYLVLDDGAVFEGKSFGAPGETRGKLAVATNMTGFAESLTDPDRKGTLLCQTFPQAGAAGINHEDSQQGGIFPAGYIVREWCAHPSNFRSEGDLDAFLKENGVLGICGIDTRALARHLRGKAPMGGAILHSAPK